MAKKVKLDVNVGNVKRMKFRICYPPSTIHVQLQI